MLKQLITRRGDFGLCRGSCAFHVFAQVESPKRSCLTAVDCDRVVFFGELRKGRVGGDE